MHSAHDGWEPTRVQGRTNTPLLNSIDEVTRNRMVPKTKTSCSRGRCCPGCFDIPTRSTRPLSRCHVRGKHNACSIIYDSEPCALDLCSHLAPKDDDGDLDSLKCHQCDLLLYRHAHLLHPHVDCQLGGGSLSILWQRKGSTDPFLQFCGISDQRPRPRSLPSLAGVLSTLPPLTSGRVSRTFVNAIAPSARPPGGRDITRFPLSSFGRPDLTSSSDARCII